MKGLSIEEKAKAYDEIIKKANKMHHENCEACQACIEELIPELAETEDERIRKALISFLKSPFVNESITDEKVTPWLAWLEKQGEHANFRNKIQIGDKVTRNEDGVLVNLSQLKRVAKKDAKQGEQKPLGFNIGDEITVNGQIYKVVAVEQKPTENKGMNLVEEEMTPFQKKVFCIIDTTIEEEQWLKQVCDELLRLAHDEIMQKSAWSEEDEKKLLCICAWIKDYPRIADFKDEMYTVANNYIDWLKNLRGRVQPQHKQELDEKDKEMIDYLIDYLESELDSSYTDLDKETFTKEINLLKSLRLHSQWKPSEEQMDTLWDAIVYVEGCNSNFKGSGSVLENLYNDLKKLKS